MSDFNFAIVLDNDDQVAVTHSALANKIGMVKKYQFKEDLLHPRKEDEARKHKLKRLVQSPNSFFMDVRCPTCLKIMTVFSHATTVVLCGNCQSVVCQPTGGKTRLAEGMSYRRKN